MQNFSSDSSITQFGIQVISTLLYREERIPLVLSLLSDEDFVLPQHRYLFRAALQVYSEHGRINRTLVKQLLEKTGELEKAGGNNLLYAISEDHYPATEVELEWACKAIKEQGARIKAETICQETIAALRSRATDFSESIDSHVRSIQDLSTDFVSGDKVYTAKEHAEESIQNMITRADNHLVIKTNIRQFDNVFTGFPYERYSIVAGRPGMGKSTFCIHVVKENGMAGKTSVVFTFEENKDQFFARMCCSIACVEYNKFEKNTLTEEDKANLIEAAKVVSRFDITVIDRRMTADKICATVANLSKQKKIDLVVIDLINKVAGRGKLAEYDFLTIVSDRLSSIPLDNYCACIAVCQLNRELEKRPDKKPVLSDLRGSGALEQDTKFCVMMYREAYYRQEADSHKCTIIVPKNTHGAVGSIEAYCDLSICRFATLEKNDVGQY